MTKKVDTTAIKFNQASIVILTLLGSATGASAFPNPVMQRPDAAGFQISSESQLEHFTPNWHIKRTAGKSITPF